MKRILQVYRFCLSLFAGGLVLAAVLGWFTAPVYAQGRAISIKGSDTMVILGQRWAEVYMSKHPGVTLQVTGGGSGVGIAACARNHRRGFSAFSPVAKVGGIFPKAAGGHNVLVGPCQLF